MAGSSVDGLRPIASRRDRPTVRIRVIHEAAGRLPARLVFSTFTTAKSLDVLADHSACPMRGAAW
jgi:hypothetical protein